MLQRISPSSSHPSVRRLFDDPTAAESRLMPQGSTFIVSNS